MVFDVKLGENYRRVDSRRKAEGYNFVSTRMVFEVKLGENYRRKSRLVADGHKTDAPTSTIAYFQWFLVIP
jgi:hypothetical protein